MSDHSHSNSPAAAGHDDHDIAGHVRVYLGVFLALLVGTVVTVGLYYVHFESMAVTITIALFIASIKAFLVAGYFMHLLSEKKMIYSMLAVTGVFFFALGALTLWSSNDMPRNTEMKALYSR
ncbi:MAG: caa(3)-type oxidase subunit IV [Verrucomicrobia bacterium]|nr:MAG: caa(3)-type oxidase subunit IV [Verrucomicrobiota bacterium]